MTQEDCFCLGRIARKFSFKGELLAKVHLDYIELIQGSNLIFVELNGNLVPFFIKKATPHNKGFIRIKFEEVNDEIQAQQLVNKNIHLSLDDLPKKSALDFYLKEIINFTVSDHKYGIIGKIKEVSQATNIQPVMIIINDDGHKILIPLVQALIKNIDKSNKTIYVESPEGLIDLYTCK